jgi:glycosyltransferase involved in cell wall biosynthesis
MPGVRKVLIVCPQCDGEDVGENWCGYEWISRLAKTCDLTVVTQRFPGHRSPSEQLPGVRIIEWDAVGYFGRYPRFNSAAKPWYPAFYMRARRWIRDALARGETFDLLHQLMPMATRYPSPCVGHGIPFIFGPVGGGVETPAGFNAELGTEPGFMKLRNIDSFRLRYDPMLRRTYEQAASIICCSGYAAERLSDVKTQRIDLEYEVGIEHLAEPRVFEEKPAGDLRMLYVGRVIRTKGLRDAIRALAQLSDLPGVTLDVAGAGEDMEACQREARDHGVADRVHFFGRLPRADLEPLYRVADVFLFPSFREPTGGVLFECMRHGLPAIVASNGGPGHIVTEDCGLRVIPSDPKTFAEGIAAGIRKMAAEPQMRQSMGWASRARIAELGLWDQKLARMAKIYDEVAVSAGQLPAVARSSFDHPLQAISGTGIDRTAAKRAAS